VGATGIGWDTTGAVTGSGIGVAVMGGGGAAAATSAGRAKPGRSATVDGMAVSPAPTRGVAERTWVMGVGSYAGGGLWTGIEGGGGADATGGNDVLATCVVLGAAGGGVEGNSVVAVATVGSAAIEVAGGVQPGGGSKALFGSTRRAGADATATGGAGGVTTGAVSTGGDWIGAD
jgi:hypothetical protein